MDLGYRCLNQSIKIGFHCWVRHRGLALAGRPLASGQARSSSPPAPSRPWHLLHPGLHGDGSRHGPASPPGGTAAGTEVLGTMGTERGCCVATSWVASATHPGREKGGEEGPPGSVLSPTWRQRGAPGSRSLPEQRGFGGGGSISWASPAFPLGTHPRPLPRIGVLRCSLPPRRTPPPPVLPPPPRTPPPPVLPRPRPPVLCSP